MLEHLALVNSERLGTFPMTFLMTGLSYLLRRTSVSQYVLGRGSSALKTVVRKDL